MNILPITARHTESNTASLHIRTAETCADWQLALNMLDEEQILGAGREAGDRQISFYLSHLGVFRKVSISAALRVFSTSSRRSQPFLATATPGLMW